MSLSWRDLLPAKISATCQLGLAKWLRRPAKVVIVLSSFEMITMSPASIQQVAISTGMSETTVPLITKDNVQLACLAQLARQLKTLPRPLTNVILLLGSAFSPGLIIDTGERPLKQMELDRLIDIRFTSVFGEQARHWVRQINQAQPMGARLAFGLSVDFLRDLQTVVQAAGHQIEELQPFSIWACNRYRAEIPDNSWVLVREAEATSLLLLKAGQPQFLLSLAGQGMSADQLIEAVEREALRAGITQAPKDVVMIDTSRYARAGKVTLRHYTLTTFVPLQANPLSSNKARPVPIKKVVS